MTRKEKPEREKRGAPAWMVSYGDMMSLLLCFFVLLTSMSSIDVSKLKQVASGMSSSVFSVVQSGSQGTGFMLGNGILQLPNSGRGLKTKEELENEGTERARQEYQELSDISSDFKTYFADNSITDSADVEIDIASSSVNIKFKDSILFDKGRADLKDQAKEILDELSLVLANYPNNSIKVEGHTDSDPIRTAQFDSNWELSSIRAIAVVRYLVEQKGFSPLNVSGEGFGSYRNVAPNDTEENKSKNRRVEIRIMSASADDIQYTGGE